MPWMRRRALAIEEPSLVAYMHAFIATVGPAMPSAA
jgi:hypothetical protein